MAALHLIQFNFTQHGHEIRLQATASHFLAGVGCLLEVSRLPFYNLRSQEFNSDAESHFQRCYICIILQLGISVAQVNQLSLHLCTNKNLLPFPRLPSSSYNHSLGSGSFSDLLPILHLVLRNNSGCAPISLCPTSVCFLWEYKD